MPNDRDDRFELKVGKPRAERGSGPVSRSARSFERQVMEAVARAGGYPKRIAKPRPARSEAKPRNGRFNAHGRGAKVVRALPRDNGWKFDASSGQRMRMRRVIVKARVVKLKGPGSRASYAHVRYLQRDGVSREGEPGQLYGRALDHPDGPAFLDRSADDPHQFRLIVAPEDGVSLGDLRSFTRELIDQIERDLETRLDWIAVDHHNTGHPHSHIVVRGVTEDGKALNIAGDYIAHGIRYRGSEILTRELGLQSQREVEQQLDLEVDQDRLTRLDRNLIAQAGDAKQIDMRQSAEPESFGDTQRYRLLRRLKKLERMSLAEEVETGRWSLSPNTEKTLRALGERGDIMKTMHRALTQRGIERGMDLYIVHHGSERDGTTTIGCVIGKGLSADEMSDRIHVVVDGIDGRVHYAEMAEAQADGVKIGSVVEIGQAVAKPREADRKIAELAHDGGDGIYDPLVHLSYARDMEHVPDGDPEDYVISHIRRLEALRRAGIVERLANDEWRIPDDYLRRAQDYDTQRTKQLGVRVLSPIDLDRQVTTNRATWLDRELLAKIPMPRVASGFGNEVRSALYRRQQWLIEQGLMQREAGEVVFRTNLLATLAQREVAAKGQELARDSATSFHMAEDGERITGRYKGAVELVSGKYALVENALEFTLVPWRPVIEKELGHTVSGLMRGDGISWEIGRGLGIGM